MNGYEHQGNLWALASGRRSLEPAIAGGRPQSADVGGPLAPEDSLHGAILAAPALPASAGAAKGKMHAPGDVEGIRAAGDAGPAHGGQAAGTGDLGVLGEGAFTSAGTLHPKRKKATSLTDMRIADVARLLNSTPFGHVVSERGIFRHRLRSRDRFRSGYRHINLPAYVVWLFEEHRREKRERDPDVVGSINAQRILGLLKRQNYCCALTGRELTPDNAALDHILPMSRGGKNLIQNAQALHKDVNRAKSVFTNEEFIQLCREVVAWADPKEKEAG